MEVVRLYLASLALLPTGNPLVRTFFFESLRFLLYSYASWVSPSQLEPKSLVCFLFMGLTLPQVGSSILRPFPPPGLL